MVSTELLDGSRQDLGVLVWGKGIALVFPTANRFGEGCARHVYAVVCLLRTGWNT